SGDQAAQPRGNQGRARIGGRAVEQEVGESSGHVQGGQADGEGEESPRSRDQEGPSLPPALERRGVVEADPGEEGPEKGGRDHELDRVPYDLEKRDRRGQDRVDGSVPPERCEYRDQDRDGKEARQRMAARRDRQRAKAEGRKTQIGGGE